MTSLDFFADCLPLTPEPGTQFVFRPLSDEHCFVAVRPRRVPPVRTPAITRVKLDNGAAEMIIADATDLNVHKLVRRPFA
jgi:hypothetical protein